MTVFRMMMNRTRFLVAMATLLVATACGGGSKPGGAAPAADRETLLPEEWGNRNFYSAYEVIESLRPLWMTRRGPDGAVQVYVDENHLGGLSELRSIRLASIVMMKHIDGIQAAARYGIGHEQGAILVTTRATRR